MKSGFQMAKEQITHGWIVISILAFRVSLFLRAVLPNWQSR
jgi:hypothetical protein